MDDPAMAPITAGLAPVRKDLHRGVGSDLVEVSTADDHEGEGRGESDQRCKQPTSYSFGRVTDDGDRFVRPVQGDLTESNSIL